jgi:hypothetical protein
MLTSAAFSLLLALLPRAPGAADAIAWEPKPEAALARALAEKKPVFVAINFDGERACDRFADKTYRDKSLVALAAASVCVIASPSEHGSGDKPCPRFGTLRCSEHKQTDKWARTSVLKPDAEGYVVAPQHVFLAPDGKVILSVPYEIGESELAWCFVTAIRAVDPASKVAFPPGAHAPRRLELGGVFDPVSARSVTPAARDEVLALIKTIKKGLSSTENADVLRRILSSDEPEGVEYIKTELRTSSGSGGDNRVLILHSIGALSPPSYWEVLAEFAQGGEIALRTEAAVSFEELAAPASLKTVQSALSKESHREVKKEWIRALAAAGSADPQVRKDLLKRAKAEKDELLRLNTLVALGSLIPGDDLTELLGSVLKQGSNAERAAAACAMAISRDPTWLAALDAAAAAAADADLVQACSMAARSLRNGGLAPLREVLAKVAQDKIERDRWYGKVPD